MNSMNIKKGDKVKVLAGKDKGKEGTILHSLPCCARFRRRSAWWWRRST